MLNVQRFISFITIVYTILLSHSQVSVIEISQRFVGALLFNYMLTSLQVVNKTDFKRFCDEKVTGYDNYHVGTLDGQHQNTSGHIIKMYVLILYSFLCAVLHRPLL